MKQQKFPGFYTAAEVREILNITEGTLYNYARSGLLTRRVPPGRKYALYDGESVDKLATQQKEFASSRSPRKYHRIRFLTGTPEDMPQTAALIQKLFDSYPNVERWKLWIQRNPRIFYLLKSGEQIAGCAFMMPHSQEKINDILAHEATPTILPEEVDVFEPWKPMHLYIRTVGIDPDVAKGERRTLGALMVGNLIKVVLQLGSEGVDIRTIVSRSETMDGIRLLRHMGFTEIPSVTSSRNFIIDVERSGIPIIQDYKKLLQRWQATHEQ